MNCKHERIYIYPITPFSYKKGSNDYILKTKSGLEKYFKVVNSSTKLGLLDVLLKLPKTDIIYFNWIEDLPSKRLGRLQIPLLLFILILCKISNKKIAWFVHNNISHSKNRWSAKRRIESLMRRFADKIISHSYEAKPAAEYPIAVFPHPVDHNDFLVDDQYRFDVLLWGKVSKYKGVKEFLEFNHADEFIQQHKICIAGKFPEDSAMIKTRYAKNNLVIEDKILDDEELDYYMSVSRCILFAYNSESVLSSAALCKSLSKGKLIIGPDKGAFRELAEANLILTYKGYSDIPYIIKDIKEGKISIDKKAIREYINTYSWERFAFFLYENLCSHKEEIMHREPTVKVIQKKQTVDG